MKKFLLGLLIGLGMLAGVAYATAPPFRSSQVGANPQTGYCLQTDGNNSTWVSGCGSGGGTFNTTTINSLSTLNYTFSAGTGISIASSAPGTVTITNTLSSVGATTTILTNTTSNGPNFTFATSSVTGLNLNISGSGSTITFAPQLQAGYNIPLTASTTNWNNLYNVLNSLTLPVSVVNGGTGTTTPGLIQGTNISITGSFPFQTINTTGVPTYAYASSTFVTYAYGTSTYQTLLTNPVTGTGTNNNCVKWTGTNTVGDAGAPCGSGGGGGSGGGWATSSPSYITTTYPNTTGALVGINTSTPTAQLTVEGTAGTTTPEFEVASSSNASNLEVLSNGQVLIGTTTSYGTLTLQQGTGNVPFTIRAADGTPDMNISSGDVNIGSNTGADSSLYILTTQPVIHMNTVGHTGTANEYIGNASSIGFSGAAITDFGILAQGNFFMSSGLDTTPILTLSSSDYVGVNSSTPTSPFTIEGTSGGPTAMFAIASSSNNTLFSVNNKVETWTMISPTNSCTNMGQPTQGDGYSAYYMVNKCNTGSDAAIEFGDQGNIRAEIGMPSDDSIHIKTVTGTDPNETFNDRITVLPSGLVGVGTTLPSQQLEVASSSPSQRVYIVADNQAATSSTSTTGSGLILTADNNPNSTFYMGTDAGLNNGINMFMNWGTFNTGLFMNSNTDIGLNNTSPAATFDIKARAGLQALNVASSSGVSELMVSTKGYIGIGTTTPLGSLVVQATSSQSTNLLSVASSSGPSYFNISQTGTLQLEDAGLNGNGMQPSFQVTSDDTIRAIGQPNVASELFSLESKPTVLSTASISPVSLFSDFLIKPIFDMLNSTTTVTTFDDIDITHQQLQGTITNLYGSYLTAPSISGGTISNTYAYVSEPSAGNWGVNTTTPIGDLVIEGTSGQTNDYFTVASSTGASVFSITPSASSTLSIGTTTVSGDLNIQDNTSNATSTMTIGSPTSPGCFKMYNTSGTAEYVTMVSTTLTVSATACKSGY